MILFSIKNLLIEMRLGKKERERERWYKNKENWFALLVSAPSLITHVTSSELHNTSGIKRLD
jgi:hypothetical protein